MTMLTRQNLANLLWMTGVFLLVALLCARAGAQPAQASTKTALTLEAYLAKVSETNPLVKAARLEKESALLKRRAGDLQELAPFLSAELGFLSDRQETLFPTQQGTRTDATSYSLSLAKKFSTGTQLQARFGQTQTDLMGLAFPFVPSWESKISLGFVQPLWKDGFGRGVRLRHEREDAMEVVARLTAEMNERRALIAAEEAYWDLAVATIDKKEKTEALARSQKLRDWTARRLSNGIGDRVDLLQIETLLASRQLAQIDANDSYVAAQKGFRDALGVSEGDYEVSADALARVRELTGGKSLQRLDVWIQKYGAKIQEGVAKETEDRLRPDLSLQGLVGMNGRDASLGTATSENFSADHPVYSVGLKFSLPLDFGLMGDTKAAARADAEAARLRMEKADRDALNSWEELARRHKEIGARAAALENLMKVQEQRLAREQDRLAVGRTTTFQVVTSEQDIADTRLALLKLRAQHRKIEANSRLFVSQDVLQAEKQ